jgi:uncharacterized membrane protein YhdT
MRYLQFTFKSEALWLLWLILIPLAVAFISAFLVPWLSATLGWP